MANVHHSKTCENWYTLLHLPENVKTRSARELEMGNARKSCVGYFAHAPTPLKLQWNNNNNNIHISILPYS